jgi:hypothetical protein
MIARLWSRRSDPAVVRVHLGRTNMAEVADEVKAALADPRSRVILLVEGFEYFDLESLAQLTSIADDAGDRVEIKGLDLFANAVGGQQSRPVIDVRARAERAVALLANVAVVTAVVDARILSDDELEAALNIALASGRDIVTLDLRNLGELTPAQSLAIAETSADLYHHLRQLILFNAGSDVARQLRRAGLSGGLRLSIDDYR